MTRLTDLLSALTALRRLGASRIVARDGEVIALGARKAHPVDVALLTDLGLKQACDGWTFMTEDGCE